MIIGIDGNEANVEKRVGISEYAFELLWQFKKYQISSVRQAQDNPESIEGSNIKYQIYLKEKARVDLPEESQNWTYRIVRPGKLWTQIGLPLDLYLSKPRPDVFFTPTHYAPRFSPIPTVVSVMDLSFLHYPNMFRRSDLYQLRNWTAYSVKKAHRVLTISKASKDDIIKIYGVPKDHVVVTYPGIKSEIRNLPGRQAGPKSETNLKFKMQNSKLLKEKYGITEDYVLFVGTLQPRKNIARLIEAFSHVILRSKATKDLDSSPANRRGQNDIMLVIVGKKGWLYEGILEAPKKFGVENSVKFVDFVKDEDLAIFYQNALCFILPSLYEGFGLPVLEAMANQCPVITSNVSSLPEAGGNAALYVDPTDTNDIADTLKLLIENEKLRKELIEKGKEQVKKFSWEKTAMETLKVLQEVAQK